MGDLFISVSCERTNERTNRPGAKRRGHRWKYPIYMQIPYLSLREASAAVSRSFVLARKKSWRTPRKCKSSAQVIHMKEMQLIHTLTYFKGDHYIITKRKIFLEKNFYLHFNRDIQYMKYILFALRYF